MAGDTFDAGTVYAEARLDRDAFKRDLAALRRDMAKFERESRMTIKPDFDPSEVATGVEQAKAWLRSLSEYRATPEVDVQHNGMNRADVEELIAAIRELGTVRARPRVEDDDITRTRREVQGLRDDFDKSWGKATTGINGLIGRFPLLLAAVTAFAGVSYGAAAAIQVTATASLSLLAIPGILAAGGVAAATLKLGMVGVGDAFKAIAEGDSEKLLDALAKMSPRAREFVGEIQKAKPAWDSMQLGVQDALFLNLGKTVSQLATAYLPMLRAEATELAMDFNDIAIGVAGFLLQAQTIKDIDSIFDATQTSVRNLGPGLLAIMQIFRDMAVVGSGFLPALAESFSNVARNLAEFVAQARASGELAAWIQRGFDTLASLGGAIISIFLTVRAVIQAARMDGAGMAAGLATITQRMQEWAQSASGQATLVDFFDKIRAVSQALGPLIGGILAALGQMVMAVLPALPPLIQGLSDVFAHSGPLLGVFTQLALAILPALGHALSFLSPILGPLVLLIGAMVTAWKIYATTVAIVELVTKGWAIAQAILNGTLVANPIGLVVVAVVALAAALVYAWNNSETFRAIVMGAWEGIKAAASGTWNFLQTVFAALVTAVQAVGQAAVWLWQNAFVPAWDGIVAGAQALGAAFTWLWETILSPVFNFIGLAARVLLAIVVTAVLAPIILAVKAAGAIFTWLWENAIKPAWDAISGAISAAWTGVIQPVLQAIVDFIGGQLTAGWNALRDAISAVWNTIQTVVSTVWNWILTNIFQPIIAFIGGQLSQSFQGWQLIVTAVWSAVQTAISAAWAFIRDNIWNPIVSFLSATLGPAFAVVRDVIVGAWNAIRDGLSTAWNFIRDNIFNPIINFVKTTIVGAFDSAVSGIKGAWDKIREIVAVPIRFMVATVYNQGIVPAWNFVAGIVNLPKLSPVNLGFATGGVVPGYSPGVDRVPAVLSPGEGVVRPEVTRAVGPGWINQVNQVAMRGGVTGVRRYLSQGGESAAGFQRFAEGGVAAGQIFARQQSGDPYVWGGVGPNGFDCSGFMSAITNVVLGQAPYSRRFATGSFSASKGAGGFVPGTGSAFVIGVSPDTGSGVGHMAGNLGGLGVESRGGNGVVVGGGARSVQDKMFPWQFYLPQVGGQFVPGNGGVDIVGKLMELWAKVTEFLGRIGEFTGTQWGSGAMGMVQNLAKGALDFLMGKASGGVLAPGTNPGINTGAAGAAGPGAGNMFDQGGIIPTGTSIVHNKTGKPELAGRLDQWATLIDSARVGRSMDSGPTVDRATMERLAGTMAELKDLIERRGTGATIHVDGTKGPPIETAQATKLALRMS
jgi:phage-related protein